MLRFVLFMMWILGVLTIYKILYCKSYRKAKYRKKVRFDPREVPDYDIYGRPECHACQQLLTNLNERGIYFKFIDISTTKGGDKFSRRSGRTTCHGPNTDSFTIYDNTTERWITSVEI